MKFFLSYHENFGFPEVGISANEINNSAYTVIIVI